MRANKSSKSVKASVPANHMTRTFKQRDSATALLKSCGVDKADYNKFIVLDGKAFTIHMLGDKPMLPADFKAATFRTAKVAVDMTTGKTVARPEPTIKLHGGVVATKLTEDDAFGGEERGTKTPKAKAAKTTKSKEPKAARVTVSSRARELIIAGKDNDAVWKAISTEFSLPESKKHYASWYRADCRRKGLIK